MCVFISLKQRTFTCKTCSNRCKNIYREAVLSHLMRWKQHHRTPYGRLEKVASRSYATTGRSVSSGKTTFSKVEVLRCCELSRVSFFTPCARTFGSCYVNKSIGDSAVNFPNFNFFFVFFLSILRSTGYHSIPYIFLSKRRNYLKK